MKNKNKIIALLICLSSFTSLSPSFADGGEKLEENLYQESLYNESIDNISEDTDEVNIEKYNPREDVEETPSEKSIDEGEIRKILSEIKEEDPLSYEQEEEIEEIEKDPKSNTGDTSRLPIVYYDKSDIDEIFKKNNQPAEDKIKVGGDYKLIDKGNSTYL